MNTVKKMNLQPLSSHSSVQKASQSHADYLFLNNALGHYQDEGNPGFSGRSPFDRAKAFGYEARVYSEGINFGAPTGISGINGLFDAPYHREPMMNPNYAHVGTGYNEDGHLIVNYGNTSSTSGTTKDDVVVYPVNGQNDVKVSWLAIESPNPLSYWGIYDEDLKVVGYPISFYYPDGYYTSNELVVDHVQLTDNNGKNLPVYDVTPERDPDENQHVMIIPRKPLSYGETYHVSVDAHVLVGGEKRDLSKAWSFTTMEDVNVTDVYFIGQEDDPDELIVEINNGAHLEIADESSLSYEMALERNGKTYLTATSEMFEQVVEKPLTAGKYTLKVTIPDLKKELSLPVTITKNEHKIYFEASEWDVAFDREGKDTVVKDIVKTFPDLPSWAKDEIIYLETNKVVYGLPDGTFGSNKTITRGEAAVMLSRAKQLDVSTDKNKPSFSDLDKKAYYYGAVEAAVKAGYFSGYPDGTFGPNDTLTREQMAKIIADAYELSGKGSSSFNDISSSWAKAEIELLAQNGIAVGTSAGVFKPRANISRAEFSVMLARAMNDDFKVR